MDNSVATNPRITCTVSGATNLRSSGFRYAQINRLVHPAINEAPDRCANMNGGSDSSMPHTTFAIVG